jgi:hypothetical protein
MSAEREAVEKYLERSALIGPDDNGINAQEEPSPDPHAEIRAAIRADLEAGPKAIDDALPPTWISYPRLPVAGAVLAAPGSTGKTTLVLGEMARISTGVDLYGDPVDMPGPCVYISAEDGATYPRYLLQRIIADGVDANGLTAEQAAHAKSAVRIVGWSRTKYGPIMRADESGNTHVLPVWDLLLELLAPIKPVYVTLDPSVLFGPGERHGNDAAAAFAALMHETAQTIGACVQTVDHVAQAVARMGIVDQYASRGGTGKVDESRLARQLVRLEAAGDTTLPLGVTNDDIAKGRILQLHWTKPSYAPRPETVWLKRAGYWFTRLRVPSADERIASAEQERAKQIADDAAILVAHVRSQLSVGTGIRYTARDLDEQRPPLRDGSTMSRIRARAAVKHALATSLLLDMPLPENECQGSRKTYLAPADLAR